MVRPDRKPPPHPAWIWAPHELRAPNGDALTADEASTSERRGQLLDPTAGITEFSGSPLAIAMLRYCELRSTVVRRTRVEGVHPLAATDDPWRSIQASSPSKTATGPSRCAAWCRERARSNWLLSSLTTTAGVMGG